MNKSVLIAAAAIVALVLWMLSGQIGSEENQQPQTQIKAERVVTAMKVQTRHQQPETITREVTIQGQVEPLKVIHMRSEASGTVKSINADKGQLINNGEIIIQISTDNRSAALAVAKAYEIQATNEHQATLDLQRQGLQSKTALEEVAAKRESARAQVLAAEIDLNQTIIRAPMTALINDIAVEVGDFIDRGGDIATLVDNSKLLITGQVPQQSINDVKVGTTAIAKLITGEFMQGKVRYISSMADAATRSFRVEVIVESPPSGAMTGVSAEISIPVETIKAHLISPAILALDNNGSLGIKAVNNLDEVTFHAIDIVKTQSDGAWVTGIPDDANIITLGQGFVNTGEKVQAVPEPTDDDSNQDS